MRIDIVALQKIAGQVGVATFVAGLIGGVVGGVNQAALTLGFIGAILIIISTLRRKL